MIEQINELRARGIGNPLRGRRLMREVIQRLHLDLDGWVVLTEAASHNFAYTPIIAALAGADKVFALTRDSPYGSVEEITALTTILAEFCGVGGRVEVRAEKDPGVIGQADLVTNLGFVRPIDRALVEMMKPTAIIPVMCEAWELRPGDIDITACRDRGIPLLGTNENHPDLDIFSYSGDLCQKLLFDAQIEVYRSRIAVIGSDIFSQVIGQHLERAGAEVKLIPVGESFSKEDIAGADALVAADYTTDVVLIGAEGQITPEDLVRVAPGVVVIHFAGPIDGSSLRECGIQVHPEVDIGPYRMALTLGALGPRPVIDLHTAGLKVGQWALEVRRENGGEFIVPLSGIDPLVQVVDQTD